MKYKTWLAFILAFMLCVTSGFATLIPLETDESVAISSASVTQIQNSPAFDWDSDVTGNHPNVLLSGGKFYRTESLSVLPNADVSRYAITRSGLETGSIEKSISSINVIGGRIIYRDDASRHIRSCDLNGGSDVELLAVNAGEVFVTDGHIYYTDLGRSSSLYCSALDGSGETLVVPQPVGSFTVSGSQIFFLGNDQALYSVSGGGLPSVLASNIERFYQDSGLILESGNTIFRLQPDSGESSLIYRSEKSNMKLAGAYGGEVFYQENGSLYAAGEKTRIFVSRAYLSYGSPVVSGNGAIYVPAYAKTPGTTAKIHPVFLTLVQTAGFYDIQPGAYYADAVQWAVNSGITAGTSETSFSPDTGCTIAHAITFLWRSNGQPAPTIENPFQDVAGESYYHDAALWAYEKGLAEGSAFGGNKPCTRSQIVTFLWKLAGSPDAGSASAFTDVAAGAAYAQSVSWAVAKGITSGTSKTTFSPDATCTRGQIVTFLYRNNRAG